ncbi:anti-sigma factor [Streptomyces sp. NPDC097619]|uniref:anti-sigma factor n=1 Tax=Streptomyces sp. NPDC097619 TaxID=3157228 RepID=UPI0033202EAE
MQHTDEETLVMMALGESPDPSASLHLHRCTLCSKELAALRNLVNVAKEPGHEEELLTPPDSVWAGIAAELRLPAQAADKHVLHDAPRAAPPSVTPGVKAGRMSRFTVALAACAALLGAASGSAITWWATRSEDPPARTVAEGRPLDALRASSAGYARMEDRSGSRTLDIVVKGLPRTTGYFEVWLMDRTHTKLVSMGVLGPDGRATLPVPANIDLDEYSVVDVSLQPYNGKPDHSGDSLVRGAYAS